MFKIAKIKLTAWYLGVIMFIMLSFSAFVYLGVDNATQRALEVQKRRMELQFRESGIVMRPFREPQPFDLDTLIEVRQRTLSTLLLINVGVLLFAGGFGYVLAGMTLKPIEMMLQKQKRFISDAAHEIKTPLTAMKTDLEVTLRDKNLSLNETKVSIESAIEEIDKLHKFTSNLLKQSRYQNGNKIDNKEALNLAPLLDKVCERLSNIGLRNNIKIHKDLKEVSIRGDANGLEELFTNLIDNAIKYSHKDGDVTVKLEKDSSHAIITIADKGVGIAKNDIPNIFEPFYRSDLSRSKETYDGYGLGLAIAKEIVTNHGGTINVVSDTDAGATFTIYFPLLK